MKHKKYPDFDKYFDKLLKDAAEYFKTSEEEILEELRRIINGEPE